MEAVNCKMKLANIFSRWGNYFCLQVYLLWLSCSLRQICIFEIKLIFLSEKTGHRKELSEKVRLIYQKLKIKNLYFYFVWWYIYIKKQILRRYIFTIFGKLLKKIVIENFIFCAVLSESLTSLKSLTFKDT